MMRRLILLAVLVVLPAALSGTASASHTGLLIGASSRVTVKMTEYRFEPATITLPVDEPVDLIFVNEGILPHIVMIYPTPKVAPKGQGEWWEYALTNTYFQKIGEIIVHVGAVRGTESGDFYASVAHLGEVGVMAGKRATVTFTPSRKGVFEIGCHLGSGPANHYKVGMKAQLIVK